MPPVAVNDALDPGQILDEFLNRVQNLPEEIRFIQEEVADKDRQYDQCLKIIEDRDGRIQKWIKANGSHEPNPKEDSYRGVIRENFQRAEQLSDEKIALQLKLKRTYDKHLLHLDKQIKGLYDRNEPGFTNPDELPSLLRPKSPVQSNKQQQGLPANLRFPAPSLNVAAVPLTPIQNSAAQSAIRAANPQVRTAQQQGQPHNSASAPASPAASHLLQRQVRESSAGLSGGASKRGPRVHSGLSTAPMTSSGLARHSSLGPGTPKTHHTATGIQRAGSAGPRAGVKSTNARLGRRGGTPSFGPGRKKAGPGLGPGSKSTLSRVKRAGKHSTASGGDSDLSDADSDSAGVSDAGTGGRSTPARGGSQSLDDQAHHPRGGAGAGRGGRPGRRSKKDRPPTAGGEDDDEDGMDVDEDDAGDDTKYCICRNVSYGDMVACDNTDDCPFEWFHWSCVGLKSEPTGTWYCPVCTDAFKKKGK
jgi:inhibitor of growth protein 3